MSKARRPAARRAPKFYARSPGSGVASPVASERGLVWTQRPDGIYQATGTGGTFWLMPTPSGAYQTTWMGRSGDQRDLGVHPYGSAVQVAARFDPVQQRRAAENPRGDVVYGFKTRNFRKGVAYFDTRDEANKVRDIVRRDHPDARVVEYDLGYAVQYRRSGPYVPELKGGAAAAENPIGGSLLDPDFADRYRRGVSGAHAASNPLDTSIGGWTRWHGDPPNEVGNLGPGQQVQTSDGWWYRQDEGADAGHLFFQPTDPNGPVMLGPELVPETDVEPLVDFGSIAYVETVPEAVAASDIPPTEELPPAVDAVELLPPADALELPPPVDFVDYLGPELPPVESLAVENPRHHGPREVKVVELPKWGSDRSKWAVVVNGRTVGQYWNRVNAETKAASLRATANPRGRRSDPTAWRHTPEGDAKYRAARAEAQSKANATGHDHGVEANDIFKTFNVMMLPRRESRAGYELRVEVVHPENLSRTQPGHGPMARENPRIPRRHEDALVKDPAHLPNAMAARYTKDLKRLGVAAQVTDSRTILPRGWDYGNITSVQVDGAPYEFKINVAQGEVSGIVSKGVGIGHVLGQARSGNVNEVIGQLVSDAAGEMPHTGRPA